MKKELKKERKEVRTKADDLQISFYSLLSNLMFRFNPSLCIWFKVNFRYLLQAAILYSSLRELYGALFFGLVFTWRTYWACLSTVLFLLQIIGPAHITNLKLQSHFNN